MFRQQFILKTSILKHIRSYREHFKSTTSVMTHVACCVLRIPIKTFHVRWTLSSSLTRRPVEEHIAGFSPSDSSHTREYITVADNRKSCRRLEGEEGTAIYGLYWYVPLWRVWFLSSLLWDRAYKSESLDLQEGITSHLNWSIGWRF